MVSFRDAFIAVSGIYKKEYIRFRGVLCNSHLILFILDVDVEISVRYQLQGDYCFKKHFCVTTLVLRSCIKYIKKLISTYHCNFPTVKIIYRKFP